MNRNEFVGDNKIERIKDPEIQPKQRWKALKQHDFGSGLVDYFIHIAFRDPMSNLWICNYGWVGNNLMFNQASMYVAKLSSEDITKNFQIDSVPATVSPSPNQTGWPWPNQDQTIIPNTIYRGGAGGTGEAPYRITYTTSNTQPAVAPAFYESDRFNFNEFIVAAQGDEFSANTPDSTV